MIIETREIYKCEHCRKMYQVKSACEKHESGCKKNPANYRPCLDYCLHVSKKPFTYVIDTSYYEEDRIVNVLYCEKLKKGVCPPSRDPYDVLYDKNSNEIENTVMPKKCDDYKSLSSDPLPWS